MLQPHEVMYCTSHGSIIDLARGGSYNHPFVIFGTFMDHGVYMLHVLLYDCRHDI